MRGRIKLIVTIKFVAHCIRLTGHCSEDLSNSFVRFYLLWPWIPVLSSSYRAIYHGCLEHTQKICHVHQLAQSLKILLCLRVSKPYCSQYLTIVTDSTL